MNRKVKLLTLILLSLSVFFIYNYTKNSHINILTLGDNLSKGITSYGIKEYGYVDYYEEYLKSKKVKTSLEKYCTEDMTIEKMLFLIKSNQKLKKDLREAHILFINVGYNDLLYKISTTDMINEYKLLRITKDIETSYKDLINEIRKYYKRKIILIGYYKTNKDNYYLNKGITKYNHILKKTSNSIYIDTYKLLENRDSYFLNPNSYYPNNKAYKVVADEIIKKTLEK